MVMREPANGGNQDGFKVIHASLYRMGTGSVAAAYERLGFRTHHVHKPGTHCDWAAFERAVDSKWPDSPGARPRPKFSRVDWEAIRGDYDIITDFLAHFTPDLIRTYPETKVVIVQRDFEPWLESYRERCIDSINSTLVRAISVGMQLFQGGYSSVEACRKQYCGFFCVRSLDDIDDAKAKRAYDDFFADIRNLVPPERRLEFDVRDGWEPLCKFLGKDIPDEAFPFINTRVKHEQREREFTSKILYYSLGCAAPLVAACTAAWYALTTS